MEQENGLGLGELLHRMFLAVKRKIVLVLAIVIIITAGGAVMANLRKPRYTASNQVDYQAAELGGTVDMTSTYFQTVVGFCNKGIVVDRANFYYDYYIHHTYASVDDFIKEIQAVADKEDPLYYDTSKIAATKYIRPSNVSVSASSSNATSISYIFTVRYTDNTAAEARDKIKILIAAIGQEANLKNEADDYAYFGTKITIDDYGYLGASVDWSKTKVVTIAFVIGLIVAFLSVYIINVSDRSIKEKSELERLTGVDLLAFIEDQEA